MAKTKTSPSAENRKKLIWPIVAVVSLVINGIFLGAWFYVTQINQLPLVQAAVTKLCAEPGYSRWMQRIDSQSSDPENNKKFAAAGICFTDYETGKILDIEKLAPLPDSTANLPARP